MRGRIDWKYALGLELTHPGFDHTVLSEFRARLVIKAADRLLLDILLARLRQLGLIKQRGRQRTDSTYVLAAVRRLNRLERVSIREMRSALSHLDELVAEAGEVVVTRRGRPLARILPTRARRNIPSRAKLRATMPKLKVSSEILVREDRELR